MAKVRFTRLWFGPDKGRYRKTVPGGFTIIRDELVPFLPSSAIVLDAGEGQAGQGGRRPHPVVPAFVSPGPTLEPEGQTLKDFDDIRQRVEADDKLLAAKTAETPAEKFARELAEEQAAIVASRDTKPEAPAGKPRRK